MPITMMSFDRMDFDAFSGAESAPDGTAPHISGTDYRLTVDGEDVVVVADRSGVEIMQIDGCCSWFLALPNIHVAVLVASNLPREMTWANADMPAGTYLASIGFERR